MKKRILKGAALIAPLYALLAGLGAAVEREGEPAARLRAPDEHAVAELDHQKRK